MGNMDKLMSNKKPKFEKSEQYVFRPSMQNVAYYRQSSKYTSLQKLDGEFEN